VTKGQSPLFGVALRRDAVNPSVGAPGAASLPRTALRSATPNNGNCNGSAFQRRAEPVGRSSRILTFAF
jgi:hypothetical protein